jgi:hypothetical protein
MGGWDLLPRIKQGAGLSEMRRRFAISLKGATLKDLIRVADQIGASHSPQRLPQQRPVDGIVVAQKRLVQAELAQAAGISDDELAQLAPSPIVELNRGVGEPVEVLVNHCLIARGEVVVVEGNYGVRILHIASRQDRMRSFK